jgi:hypothetical protein
VTRARYQYSVGAFLVREAGREDAKTVPGIVASAIGPVLASHGETEALTFWEESLAEADGHKVTGAVLRKVKANHPEWKAKGTGAGGGVGVIAATQLTRKVFDLTDRCKVDRVVADSLTKGTEKADLLAALVKLESRIAGFRTELTKAPTEAEAPADKLDGLPEQVEKVLQATGS